MSNGPIINCASGECCPPPMQEKALAVLVKEAAEAPDPTTGSTPPRFERGSPPAESLKGLYLKIARGLIAKGIIGVSPDEAARLRKEGSPTEEELDEMLSR